MIPARQRRSAALLGMAIALLAGGLPLLHWAQGSAAREATQTAAAMAKTEEAQRQLQSNIAAAHELAGRISEADVVRLLAPIDRLQTAGVLERQATAARLTHFTYTLAAERKDIAVVTGEATPGLVVSAITITADAPLDTDVFAFLAGLQTALPGRLRVVQMMLARTGDGRQPVAASNVHVEARLDWLSNGSARALAGVP